MKNTFIPSLLLLAIVFPWQYMSAQQGKLFMPKEIRKAYENGTRSYDGKPGPNYWQNLVDYQIEVEVNPAEKKLTGSETVTFHNNSPELLSEVVVRLYHDVFREANARAYRVQPDDITEGVELTKLVIDGNEIDLDNPRATRRQGTNMSVTLPTSLEAGAKLEMEIDWVQFYS